MKAIRFANRARQETGSVLVFAVVSVIALIAFAALTIDVVRYCQQKRDMQSATDAAALAGALLLTNSPQNATSITTNATVVALANGIRTNELGTIQVGQWDTNTTPASFVANAKPYNAVLVPAQRTFPTTFGAVLGTTQMMPSVHSVAMLGGAGSAVGAGGNMAFVPFGVASNYPLGALYTTNTITQTSYSGNFGKLNVGTGDWSTYMEYGCGCTVSIGESLNTITGDSEMGDTFRSGVGSMTVGTTIIMPVVSSWPSGSSAPTTIVGFVGELIIALNQHPGNGSWSFTLENVPVTLGTTGGGTTNPPYASARVLVQ